MLVCLAWLMGSKSQSQPDSGGLGPKGPLDWRTCAQEGGHFEPQKCQNWVGISTSRRGEDEDDGDDEKLEKSPKTGQMDNLV